MKKVLVPISFSETSRNALRHAHSIANHFSTSLSLLHCYPEQDYNRTYDFGNLKYSEGIEAMLREFFNEITPTGPLNDHKFIAAAGSASETIAKLGLEHDLLILSRKTGFQSRVKRWLSDKLITFIDKSPCPVLILAENQEKYSFIEMKSVWHIQRNDVESGIVKRGLKRLNLDSVLVSSKSLEQRTFTSDLWQNIVKYSKTHEVSLTQIASSFKDENVDLIVLVNHRKGLFEKFLKGDTFQILSQLDIPILIFQA